MGLRDKTKLINEAKDSFIGISRSEFKKLTKEKLLTTKNGKLSIENRDKLVLYLINSRYPNLQNLPAISQPFKIVFEDDNTLIVDKISGIPVHIDRNNEYSIKEYVQMYILMNSSNPFAEIQPVNRLDKDTSGIVLFSKNSEAHAYYSQLFKYHFLTKKYLAVSYVNTEITVGEQRAIESYISKTPKNREYFSTIKERGEFAKSTFKVISIFNKQGTELALIEVTPETGRTHQIRVHLSENGLPIVGDKIYSKLPGFYKRLMLHSYSLSLVLFREIAERVFTSDPHWTL